MSDTYEQALELWAVGASRFIEDIYNEAQRAAGPDAEPQCQEGRDLVDELSVILSQELQQAESALSARLRVYSEIDTCPVCKGTGRNPMSDTTNWLPCGDCQGTGVQFPSYLKRQAE